MRAALYDRYGGPGVLYEGTVPAPVPRAGEVLVRVHATSVNGGEPTVRAGKLRAVAGRGFPKRTGVDFAGEVAALGNGVSRFTIGDRVWGVLGRTFGTAAEYVAVSADRPALAPAGLDLVRAAALPAAGTTALTALRDKARLGSGERLLVRGGAGGVGSIAVQLGRAYGAHVTALAGAKHLDFVRELGADEALDYSTTAPEDLGRFDVVLDTVGTRFADFRRLLSPTGRMVAITFDSARLLRSVGALLAAAVFDRRVHAFSGNPRHDLLADLTRLTEAGDIEPVVDRTYPLAEIAEAHRAFEAGGIRGKLVVTVA
ncbi:NAD(P)-dependent alcohol dehydrogenase [Amycolatopsis magusensis]|uniref:NADPH:quinone reductase-like Zn-dependent oxidoreductase n=1 Tax=Amycolatopsis magusensis TaxID=882444 RepID=A0ABS4PZN6_9PSEU|nr:NAD(P)-dependent alcohol dehydrogenase [Amycolatopsis magusensis]MBP2184882.1 NADPH:quinone reductase-like Zn-dependent oxidoreductase [Amycolatopsis magusensis]